MVVECDLNRARNTRKGITNAAPGRNLNDASSFALEGAHNAWNYLGRYIDFGTLGSFAAVVAQPRVGLRPYRRRRFCTPHRRDSRASGAYLGIVPACYGWLAPALFADLLANRL